MKKELVDILCWCGWEPEFQSKIGLGIPSGILIRVGPHHALDGGIQRNSSEFPRTLTFNAHCVGRGIQRNSSEFPRTLMPAQRCQRRNSKKFFGIS